MGIKAFNHGNDFVNKFVHRQVNSITSDSTGLDAVTSSGEPPPVNDGMVASGGVVNDYTVSSDVYRAHIFTSSGAFAVSTLSTDPDLPNTIEYLVIAGGGGGG